MKANFILQLTQEIMKQKGRQTTVYLHTDCSPSLNRIWMSDIQKLFNRMKITNTNIQIISLSFAKNQPEIPVFLLKYKIILCQNYQRIIYRHINITLKDMANIQKIIFKTIVSTLKHEKLVLF